jgi:hypothetical protein
MLRYVRSSSVVSRVIADEVLIVPIRRGVGDLASIYSLNPAASAIWNAISEARTKSEIVELLQQEFDAPTETVLTDVEAFLSEMCAAGLVETAEIEAAA